ncbi:MAG: NB-ARC domain-containing protein [Cyanobacteria bacterium P01_F01_bin.150]
MPETGFVISILSMSFSPKQRLALKKHVNALVQTDFDDLVFALEVPSGVIPSGAEAQGNRSSAFFQWVEGPTGCGIEVLLDTLDEIAPLPNSEQLSNNKHPSELAPQPETLTTKNWAIPLQMPPLPDHFVERPDYQNAVKEQLLSNAKVFGTLVVSAIYGLGGIGKSVLASKLAHDGEIQKRFADGILWVTLGQNPDLLPLLSGWIQALGDHDYKPTALQAASVHLRTLLYDKKMLLVVDDVWNPEHLEPFRVGGSDCCVLVTTREARIPEAHRYDLDVMRPEQALELMTQKLSEELSGEAKDQALAFAKRVGYLPLALELAATQIEEGVTWVELLEDFQAEVARVEGLDLYCQEDIPEDAKRRKYSLLACFNLSLKQLSTEQLRQFAWLGVGPEDVNLTQEMATTLWQVTARQAGAILRQFGSKALLLPGVKQRDGRRTYRLHDLMHDLAQRLLVSPPQPMQAGDLPGLGLTKPEAHHQLLERYRAKTSQGLWHTLRDDGYIYDRLTWHMEQARQPQEVHRLLQEITKAGRNGWYEVCNAIGKPAGFVNDVGRAWRIAQSTMEDSPGQALVHLYRYALIRTSLNSLASNIPTELVKVLVKHEVWQPSQGLAYAQQMQDPWRKAKCISALVSYIPNSLLPEVLTTIGQIKDAVYRSFVLSKLAERYPDVWPSVLKAIAQIKDRYGKHREHTPGFADRATAIVTLTPVLPQTLIPEALILTQQIQNASDRVRALIEIAKISPVLVDEALEITGKIKSESNRASALIEIAKISPELIDKALNATRKLESVSDRARALIEIAKVLPELVGEALNATRKLKSESDRVSALIEIAKISPELIDEALNATRKLKSESNRDGALQKLIKILLKERPEKTLEVIRQIKSESRRASALIEMAKLLPKEIVGETLEVIRQIQETQDRAYALSGLAKVFPDLVEEALEVTKHLHSEYSRNIALRELAEVLPKEYLGEALSLTQQIQDQYSWACSLCEMAETFPSLLREALKVTRQIQSEFFRAIMLSELTKFYPEIENEALEATRQIQSKYYRAYALLELVEVLPELWEEILEVTKQIQPEFLRAIILSELPRVFPKEQLEKVFEATQYIQDESHLSMVLNALTEVLPEERLEEILEIARKIQNNYYRASTLSELAKFLPGLEEEVLDVTRQIQDEFERTQTLSKLITIRPELLEGTLTAIRHMQDEDSRARTLRTLGETVMEDKLEEVLTIIWAIQDEGSRSFALRGLVKFLPQELLINLLPEMQEFEDRYYCASAWQGLLPRIEELSPDPDCLIEALDTLAYQNRKQFLETLPKLRVTLTRLGGENTVMECLQVMREVCGQWP